MLSVNLTLRCTLLLIFNTFCAIFNKKKHFKLMLLFYPPENIRQLLVVFQGAKWVILLNFIVNSFMAKVPII